MDPRNDSVQRILEQRRRGGTPPAGWAPKRWPQSSPMLTSSEPLRGDIRLGRRSGHPPRECLRCPGPVPRQLAPERWRPPDGRARRGRAAPCRRGWRSSSAVTAYRQRGDRRSQSQPRGTRLAFVEEVPTLWDAVARSASGSLVTSPMARRCVPRSVVSPSVSGWPLGPGGRLSPRQRRGRVRWPFARTGGRIARVRSACVFVSPAGRRSRPEPRTRAVQRRGAGQRERCTSILGGSYALS